MITFDEEHLKRRNYVITHIYSNKEAGERLQLTQQEMIMLKNLGILEPIATRQNISFYFKDDVDILINYEEEIKQKIATIRKSNISRKNAIQKQYKETARALSIDYRRNKDNQLY